MEGSQKEGSKEIIINMIVQWFSTSISLFSSTNCGGMPEAMERLKTKMNKGAKPLQLGLFRRKGEKEREEESKGKENFFLLFLSREKGNKFTIT